MSEEMPTSIQSNKDAEHENNNASGLKKSAKHFAKSVGNFIKDRLSILDNAQPEQTIQGIERDIDFKGFNLWILIPAILIASIGLNANSTAVIIGAMLISPLMGPIIGLGLSIGINDLVMLRRSLRNLGIAIVVSIITSSLFFFLIPINDASSELLARTQPDIRDVFIAFFGGFAGILAGSRKEKSNVIPGVAIATALMPPLCTAGYGIATLQFEYFLGASYLFLINAFFIALAAVLVTRYLRFPPKKFIDKKLRQRARLWLVLTVIVMIVPASVIFVRLVQNTIFLQKVNQFVEEEISYGESTIVKKDIVITDSTSYVNLVIFGEIIPDENIEVWQNNLNKLVNNTTLHIYQGTDKEGVPEVGKLVDLYTNTQNQIASKEQTIQKLEETLKGYQREVLPTSLIDEIKINYPEVMAIKMGRILYTDFSQAKTIVYPHFYVKWAPTMPDSTEIRRSLQLERWLSARLQEDSVNVTSYQ